MLGWRQEGRQGPFPVLAGSRCTTQVRIAAEDVEGRKKLAGYMLRAPMSLAKMSNDAQTGTVIYRSKMHLGLKRNFQVMPGAQWLALLCRHRSGRGFLNSAISGNSGDNAGQKGLGKGVSDESKSLG